VRSPSILLVISLQTTAGGEIFENVALVVRVHLLQEDEREYGVRAEARVVWREALP